MCKKSSSLELGNFERCGRLDCKEIRPFLSRLECAGNNIIYPARNSLELENAKPRAECTRWFSSKVGGSGRNIGYNAHDIETHRILPENTIFLLGSAALVFQHETEHSNALSSSLVSSCSDWMWKLPFLAEPLTGSVATCNRRPILTQRPPLHRTSVAAERASSELSLRSESELKYTFKLSCPP